MTDEAEIGKGNITTATSIPDTWGDLYKLDHPIDFEAFLQSDLLSKQRKTISTIANIRHCTGSLSVIASTAIIWHILRSFDGISTTYHRLVFGLCIADFMTSAAFALNKLMVPREMDYFTPNARGNVRTCDAQGYIIVVGSTIAALYNCSICFYYLAIIKYSKKEEYISKKLEPWFHAISIMIPVICTSITLPMGAFNAGTLSACFAYENNPPHCIGYQNGEIPEGFSIPCGRGDLDNEPFGYASKVFGHIIALVFVPLSIFVTMTMMYRAVLKIEKKMTNYGVASLRLRVNSCSRTKNRFDGEDKNQDVRKTIKEYCKSIVSFGSRSNKLSVRSKSNNVAFQKRAILNIAFGYALAWFLQQAPYILVIVTDAPIAKYLFATFSPLQGCYNFIVYMYPKVRRFKRTKKENYTLYQAFLKAWVSRGEKTTRNTRERMDGNRSHGRHSLRLPSMRLRRARDGKKNSTTLNTSNVVESMNTTSSSKVRPIFTRSC